jgi:hypothetical protein
VWLFASHLYPFSTCAVRCIPTAPLRMTKRGTETTSVSYSIDQLSDEDIEDYEMGDFEDLEVEGLAPALVESTDGEGEDETVQWAGFEEEENDASKLVSSAVASDPTVRKVHLPPSGEQLRRIREASELFQSSSFKLQVRL